MPSQSQLDEDIRLILAGGLHADAIGPDQVAVVRGRVQAAADEYLRRFEDLLLGPTPAYRLQSDILVGALLAVTVQAAPDATRAVAQRLSARLEQMAGEQEDVEYDSEAAEPPSGKTLAALQIQRQRRAIAPFVAGAP